MDHISNHNFLNIFDLYAQSPQMHIHSRKKYHTKFGIIIGFLSLVVMLILSGYFVLQTFSRENLSILFNQDSTVYPSANISNMPLVFSITDDYENPIPDSDRVYNIDVKLWKFYTTKNEAGDIISQTDIIDVPLERCNISKHFGNYKSYFENSALLSTAYCTTPGISNLTLYGSYGDANNGYSFLDVMFYKCINGVYPPSATNCLDKETIDNRLSTIYLTLGYIDFDINHKNSTDVLIPIVKLDAIPLSLNLFKRIFDFKKPVLYDTDYGYVFEDISTLR